MKEKELIPVFVRIENGQTTCICKQGNKKCDRVDCERDMVERDAYRRRKQQWAQEKHDRRLKRKATAAAKKK